MAMVGFSLNNLSLFGIVLAIGIVVDDAIVVVENVERNMAAGLSPRDAAIRSMDEVGAALIAICLVLCAVFIPSAFITGISGQFYRQFALTIAGATVISLVVSLTLSPALCALLLKPHDHTHRDRWWERPIHGAFGLFNRGFTAATTAMAGSPDARCASPGSCLVVYVLIIAGGGYIFSHAPSGFIPQQDRAYLIGGHTAAAREHRSRAPTQWCGASSDIALATPGVGHAIEIVGFSGATFTNAPNAAAMFLVLEPFAKRAGDPRLSADAIQRTLFGKFVADPGRGSCWSCSRPPCRASAMPAVSA